MKTSVCVWVLAFFCLGFAAFGQNATAPTVIDAPEFQARRKAALEKVPDGIILLRSAWGMKHWDESGFHQNPSFYYFTGLANAHAAILALDGTTKESRLFVAPRSPFGADLHGFDAVFSIRARRVKRNGRSTTLSRGISSSRSSNRAARIIPRWFCTPTAVGKRDGCLATIVWVLLRGSVRCKIQM
jgi:hypothetical protein